MDKSRLTEVQTDKQSQRGPEPKQPQVFDLRKTVK